MKCSAKRLLSLALALAMALMLLPAYAMAETVQTVLSEGTLTFATDDAAFTGEWIVFVPDVDGDVTVEVLSSTPGYYMEFYGDGFGMGDHCGTGSGSVSFPVYAGTEYEVLFCSYDAAELTERAGSVQYQITFFYDHQEGEDPDVPEDPALIPGATPENPLVTDGQFSDYIAAGQTLWFLYDNTRNMTENGVYSMMLHIVSGADYAVTYGGENVPVDEVGFVNYEMKDTEKQGTYLFSVANNSTQQAFFTVEVKERPVYAYGETELSMGRNSITLDTSYTYTLYPFRPDKTGVYQIKVSQGMISNWGSVYNPINTTTDKTNTLIWTCTSVGQSVMVGFSGPKAATCTIIRTGDYIPDVEIPWDFYKNTYEFDRVLDAGAETVDVDLTDGGAHQAVLDKDNFYHYGSEDGPLMVTDLRTIEINIADASLNGGLRAWLLDDQGNTISKIDYNAALLQYHDAGLVPVTRELATMLQEVGIANGWWVSGGLIFTGDVPQDLSQAWMQLCAYLAEPEGVMLSGSISADSSTVELLKGGQVIGTAVGASYCFENVLPGTYILRASKVNHVTREYTVTVEDEAVTLNVTLCLIGDVDGNGKVNMGDVSKLLSHIRGSAPIGDEYLEACGNVNGGSLNMGDIAALYGHIRGSKTLY